MKDINIEINVCDSTGKSTCTVHPHTCCHSDNGSGQEPGVSGVASVFGRTGVVTPQSGDYTADQITETATRKFVTSDEKAVWNAKQNELISGTTIRTLFGQSLLGSGDLSLTPAQMGAAAVGHTHTTAEITDYTQKTKQLIHSSLEAGTGVTLSYNPASEKTVISATGGGSGSGSSGYVVADRQGATAGQNHVFSISPQNKFNLAAYALKEDAGTVNQTYIVDEFNVSSEPNYNATGAVIFDGKMKLFTGSSYDLTVNSDFYSTEIVNNGEPIDIKIPLSSIVPSMSSNILPTGYIVSQDSYYDPAWMGWLAFDGVVTGDTSRWSATNTPAPHWLSIQLPVVTTVDSYSITARQNMNVGGTPIDFELQGSNDGKQWNVLDSRSDITFSSNEEKKFKLSVPSRFNHYRLYITRYNTTRDACTIQELRLFGTESRMLIRSGGRYYTSHSGIISEVKKPESGLDIELTGFYESGVISSYDVQRLAPFEIISSHAISVTVNNYPINQIAIQKSLMPATWPQINSATLTATQTGNGKVRVAVTRDLVNWHVLRNGVWVDVGPLSADTAGATALIADGMTPAELGSITAAQWTQLFASNNGVPDSLAFAFALDITDPVADVATIDRLALNVNDASSWKVQSPAEVEIRWRTDSVTFRTATAGNYKLAYQVP
ncbi:discoidin domain-containing protein [Pectobacterium punjabense]|uniref:discoidin domain-containing protein n=1 Tax=Pectobacterium punjabense TaxID=2108399 RepID=UPI002B24C2A7|nr:discoidin domain-containing protein [Pectobacterium punjabense]